MLQITHCIHGLDLRLHPRCYLCRPFGTDSRDYPQPFVRTDPTNTWTVRCTCPPDRGDNYAGSCPIHDVATTYTG